MKSRFLRITLFALASTASMASTHAADAGPYLLPGLGYLSADDDRRAEDDLAYGLNLGNR